MDYQFASYEPRFRAQLIDLYAEVFNESRETSAAYFRWKYEANPYIAEPLFTVALQGERVIAMRGYFGGCWSAGAASVLVPVSGDTAIDPAHRGRWLFDRMMRFALTDLSERGYPYIFNFSGNEAVRLLSLRSGWRQLATYDPWERRAITRGPQAWVARTRRYVRRRLGGRSPGLAALGHVPASALGGARVASAPQPAAMAELVARNRGERLGHVRDEAFYEWRFRDPRYRYRFLTLEGEAGLAGFFVLQQQRSGGWVNVVDWCAENVDAWSTLLRASLASRLSDIQIWSANLPEEYRDELQRAGFGPREDAPADAATHPGMLITHTEHAPAEHWEIEGAPLLDADRWDLRMAYSDGY